MQTAEAFVNARLPIPKRLAARIRSAQCKVASALSYVEHREKSLADTHAQLKFFELLPESYARRYTNCSVDSYPVQVSTLRMKVRREQCLSEMPSLYEALAQAQATLEKVKQEVLAEISKMRPTTGRVPWPSDLPKLTAHTARRAAQWAQQTSEATEAHRQSMEGLREKQTALEQHEWERRRGPVEIEMDIGGFTEADRPNVAPLVLVPFHLRGPMKTLGVAWPVSADALRSHYMDLVRQHHPDATGGDRSREEVLKHINVAYAAVRDFLATTSPA